MFWYSYYVGQRLGADDKIKSKISSVTPRMFRIGNFIASSVLVTQKLSYCIKQ
jgi:hypothetical protein